MTNLPRRLLAEGLGSMFLLATVVGSGIMAERLCGGNIGVALLANTIATGATLLALIITFGAVSGAHFNPAVSLLQCLLGRLSRSELVCYVLVQLLGAVIGVAIANLMFEQPLFFLSQHSRTGNGQWLSEFIATSGLLTVVLGCSRQPPPVAGAAISSYIMAAYWFTASTSFANPAVTIARTLSDTFSGIRPADAPAFILVQFSAAILTALLSRLQFWQAE